MYTDKKPLLYKSITQVINRGSAEILENCDKGIFIKDTVSGVCMLVCDSFELSCKWLTKHEDIGYTVLAVFDSDVAGFAAKRYGFSGKLECYQAVYTHSTAPEYTSDLIIREADMTDFEKVSSVYDKITEEELKQVIGRKELFIGMRGQEMAGFAGRHLEGSIGILEVLPQYRKRGYGKALECFMIKYMLDKGLSAFCQVETHNEISRNLQLKLGYTVTDEKIYFLY